MCSVTSNNLIKTVDQPWCSFVYSIKLLEYIGIEFIACDGMQSMAMMLYGH